MNNHQTVLITGASSGIGKELAILFAEHHYDVVLVARSHKLLDELAQQLSQQHKITATVIAKDFSQVNAVKELYQELQAKNITINILINNAAYGTYGAFAETELSETMGMIAVNISALTELTYLLLPHMLKSKSGKIMNVSSIGAFQACPTMAVYCATKAYVLSFSEALTEELRNTGITVTSLCPGATITSFQIRAKTEDSRLLKNRLTVMTAKQVADIGFSALIRGKSFVISGFLNNIFAFFTRLTPRRINTKMAGMLMK